MPNVKIDFKKAIARIDYKKAVAAIDFQRAIAAIKTGKFVLSKELSDSATVSDLLFFAKSTFFSDTIDPTDSGSIRMQDYCDFTYFAEDYVGSSTTF